MQAYGTLFARVYNRLWQDYASRIAPLIYEFYEATPVGKNHRTLLDVCCGTGQLAVFFLEKGYRVVGLDLSEAMLAYARENTLPYIAAQQARFIQGDAANFRLDETFGLVISTYDALNHLPDMTALEGCFRSAFDVLVEGGYLIFDLNTRFGLANWNRISIDPGDDIFLLNRGIFDEEMDKAWTKITGFVRTENGLYARFDEVVYNMVFEMQAVKELLLDSGFKQVAFARGTALAVSIEEPEKEGKVFVVANKKG